MDTALDMRDCVAFVKDPRPEFDEDPTAHVRIRLKAESKMTYLNRQIYVGILCFESEVFNFLFSNFSFRLVPSYFATVSLLPRLGGKDYSILHRIQKRRTLRQ